MRPHYIIPRRSAVDRIYSTIRAAWDLTVSPAQRDKCLSLINSGIINPMVLGIPQSLALYNELSSPLLLKHDFNSKEFMVGAKMGLERYHEIEMQLHNNQIQQTLKEIEGCDTHEEKREKLTKATLSEHALKDLSDGHHTEDNSNEWEEKSDVVKEEIIRNELRKYAEESAESLHGQLLRFLSPLFFDNVCDIIRRWPLNVFMRTWPQFPNYRLLSTEVSNAALVSARAQVVMPQPLTEDEASNIKSEEEAKKNDDFLNNIYSENDFDKFPVVAQVEVLYDVHVESTISDEEDKIMPTSHVKLAVFEGYLHQSPDGNPLRWVLSQIHG